ncbi:UDP-2-acetamido-2,6-beta-L-arabino-hexul-4-ose reductase [Brachymonas denitrificans]|uniref:UDP-2-acetamido-2,6-beta-L-arabino-hexul-4-ose reductase n=1 Tax=Brachymonas denitrificans TaxID=28220 RepID=UPI00321F658F
MSKPIRKILITGSNGFIGKNLAIRLNEMPSYSTLNFVRGDDVAQLPSLIAEADAVIHLAGENRPQDDSAFTKVNANLTALLCETIEHEINSTGRKVPLVFTSSTQADRDNPYGRSKLHAERSVRSLAERTGNPCAVFRLPGVFGKWCKPNYNSVVATFCHNIARGLPIEINDTSTILRLVYIDDVVDGLIEALDTPSGLIEGKISPEYTVTLGELASQLSAFNNCRTSLVSERVGTGLVRALYATYVSYLPNERFSYEIPQHGDARGVFVEMLKTHDSGQFSYFTAHPGITRGGHYHHTKTEKFLVIKGQARFRFRHLITDERIEFETSGTHPRIIDTIPGWTHDITNVGSEELIVMLWANENFDREKPDTVSSKV